MANYNRQISSPIHLENSALVNVRDDLSIGTGQAFTTFAEMKYDPVIAGALDYIKALITRVDYRIAKPDTLTSDEAKLVNALNDSLQNMDGYTKRELIGNALSMLEYGSSLFEITFKRENGKQVFDSFSPIHLSTVNRFEFKSGKLQKIELAPAENDGLIVDVDVAEKSISGDKLIMCSLQRDMDSPLGRSLLTGVYTSWKQKKIIEEYRLVGIAKSLSGVLKICVPSEYLNSYYADPASEEAQFVEQLLDQADMLHAGQSSSVLVPSDVWGGGQQSFEVTTIGGETLKSDLDVSEIIRDMNTEMLIALQTSVLAMGNGSGGSYALSENQSSLLSHFVQSVLGEISDAFHKAIKLAFELNGLDPSHAPKLEFDSVFDVNIDEFSKALQRLTQVGLITPTTDTENHLRDVLGLPVADYTQRLKFAQKGSQSDIDNDRFGDKEG